MNDTEPPIRGSLPKTQRPDPAAPSEPRPSPVGQTLNDNYRIDRLVGEGGMGEVYEGRHLFTGNRVAIKMILRELSNDENIVGLFRREARILSELTDDSIVRYLDSFYHAASDRYCLVMQFIDGVPLADRLREGGALDEADVKTLMRRLAEGLQKAHMRGVVHRDLSPDNVMLRGGRVDRAALIDFGIATAEDQGEATLFGQFAGKYRFVAPEQLGLAGGLVDARTDIYGLGLLIAAALRGTALEMGRSFPEAVQVRERVPDLRDVPATFRPLLTRMLQPDPADRPDDMAMVVRFLDARVEPTAPPAADRTVISSPPGYVSRPPVAPQPISRAPISGLGQPIGRRADDDAAPFRLEAVPTVGVDGARTRRRRIGWLLGSVALLAIGLVAVWIAVSDETAPDAAEPETALGQPELPMGPELPPPDRSTREGFLAGFADAAPCSYATRITAGADNGRIAVFARDDTALPGLAGAYGDAFGIAPDLVRRPVTDAQCPALDLVGGLQGRGSVPPVLTLDTDAVQSSGTVLGRLAQVRGRGVWLALVTADGLVYDLSSRLESQPDGSFLFGFTLNAASVAAPQPQLILALASNDPIVAAAAMRDGSAAGDLMQKVLADASEAGAAAQIARFVLTP